MQRRARHRWVCILLYINNHSLKKERFGESPAAGGGGGSVGRRRRRWREARGDSEMAETLADTRRLITKPQNLNDAYGPPSNFLEIDVSNPQTVRVGRGRFTTYEIRVKTNLPIFTLKDPLLEEDTVTLSGFEVN